MIVERFESALWETSSLLLSNRAEAVLVDPAVSAAEVARIAARISSVPTATSSPMDIWWNLHDELTRGDERA